MSKSAYMHDIIVLEVFLYGYEKSEYICTLVCITTITYVT